MLLRQERDGLPQALIRVIERRQFLAVLLPLGSTFPTPISFPLPILFRQISLPDGLLRMMTCLGKYFPASKIFSTSGNEAREIGTPNLLIWSQTRYRCAIAPRAKEHTFQIQNIL